MQLLCFGFYLRVINIVCGLCHVNACNTPSYEHQCLYVIQKLILVIKTSFSYINSVPWIRTQQNNVEMLDYKKCLFYGVVLLQHGESHKEQIEVNNEQDLGRNCSASCGEWSLSHKSFRSYYSDLCEFSAH